MVVKFVWKIKAGVKQLAARQLVHKSMGGHLSREEWEKIAQEWCGSFCVILWCSG